MDQRAHGELVKFGACVGEVFRNMFGSIWEGFGQVSGGKMEENSRGKRGKLYRKLLSSKYFTDY